MKVYRDVRDRNPRVVDNAVNKSGGNVANYTLISSSASHLKDLGFKPLVWTKEGRVIGVMGAKVFLVNPNAGVLSDEFFVMLGENQRLTGAELYVDVYNVEFPTPDSSNTIEGYRITITDDIENRRKKILDILVSKQG